MKRFAAVLLALIVPAFVFASYTKVYSQEETEQVALYARDRILVQLKLQSAEAISPAERLDGPQAAQSILSESAETIQPLDPANETGLYLLQLNEGVSVEEALQRASSDPRVEFAEPDYYLYPAATMPNDSYFGQMWGLFNSDRAGVDIGATRAWDLTQGSEDVVVAVVDTGTDLTHPDLAGNAWVNPREIAGDGVDNDNNGLVDDINGWNFLDDNNQLIENAAADAHGTHVAGTIGAVGNNGMGTVGVTWRVKLMSLKFLGSKPGTTSNAIKAINYAIEQKEAGVNVRVINASWGGPGDSSSLQKAIRQAGDAGILFVCAAGNGGTDSRGDNLDDAPDYPAAWSNGLSSIVSVAALDRSDFLASFSNYGRNTVTVAAPGVQILSTRPGGDWSTMSGTSMATPHVSGVAALLVSYNPSLTPSQIRQRIIRTSDPVLKVASKVLSSGRINAYNALTDTLASTPSLGVNAVRTDKKFVYVDGLGFAAGSIVIEVNGGALKKAKVDGDYQLPAGSYSRVSVKLGKAGVKETFPQDALVYVTAYNPATGERSSPVPFIRR